MVEDIIRRTDAGVYRWRPRFGCWVVVCKTQIGYYHHALMLEPSGRAIRFNGFTHRPDRSKYAVKEKEVPRLMAAILRSYMG
jgi:hypothetical protein